MVKLLHLYKKVLSINNRKIIKNIYKREESLLPVDKEIQVIVETPSGEYWKQKVQKNSPFLYTIRNGIIRDFSIHDLVYIYNNQLHFFQDYRVLLIKPPTQNYLDFSKVKKLIINNQHIKEVNLNSLDLEYVDLRNNFLSKVIYNKELRYCDLRGNKIKKSNIKSEILLEDNIQKSKIGKSRPLKRNFYLITSKLDHKKELIDHKKELIDHKKELIDHKKELIDHKLDPIIRNTPYTKYKLYNISYRFYIVQRDIPDFKFILKTILSTILPKNLIDIIEDIYYKLKKICTYKGEFYIACITEEEIIIKTYKSSVIMDYFLRREEIYKEHTYIFDNIGKWYIIPQKGGNDYSVIITNQGNTRITDTKLVRQCTIQDPYIVYKKYTRKEKITKDKKIVFMFIKFYETRTGSKSNLKKQESLLKRLKNIPTCMVIEDNGTDGIIFMSQNLNAILCFSLYIKKVFMAYKIDLSIGIACGEYFFKMDDKRSKFLGNVLNTASRMSYLGKGVYCCECAVVDSDKVYFQYAGEREVRGYDKCIKTYLVYHK